MADGPRILEVRAGRGDPASISLKQGTVLDPTSIGSGGMWRVTGTGVLEVHGYVYFDGKALFVQSADDRSPLTVNKHRVATAWTEVRAPSSIALGEAEIVYRDEAPAVYDDGDETIASALPAPNTKPEFVPGGGMFANRADDESTRFAPIEGIPGAAGPAGPGAAFAATALAGPVDLPPGAMTGTPGMPFQPGMGVPGMPGMQPGMPGMQPGMPGMQPGMQPMQAGMPPGMQGMPGMAMQPGMQGMQPGGVPGGTAQTDPGQGKQGWAKFKAEWEALEPRKRVLYIMAPFTMAAACFILFDDPPPVNPVNTTPSASVSGSAPHPPPSGSAPLVMVGPPDAGTAEVTADEDAGGEAPPTTAPSSTVSTNDKADAGTNNGAPPPTPNKRTTERMAADAWAEGNFAKAAKLYDELAKESPQNPAYREAARILRERIDGGAP